jgi:AraC-like DNA-binding protein
MQSEGVATQLTVSCDEGRNRRICVDSRIKLILGIIENQKGSKQLRSKEAGDLLGLSEEYFLRLFHREVRTTFRRYLREIRMIRAAHRLKDHTLSIKEIAVDSGYSEISNFYRDFKQVHQMNPREVRLKDMTSSAPLVELE